MNYYEILEVSPNASQEVLKAAYKSLMQRYHPDRNQGNAEAAMHAVLLTQAYEVLSDTSSRAAYDADLKLQRETLNSVRDRGRYTSAPASPEEEKRKSHWFLWMLVGLIVLFFWYIFTTSWKSQPAVSKAAETRSLIGNIQLEFRQDKLGEGAASPAARTISAFFKDIIVNLHAPAESSGAASYDQWYTLSIQTIDVIVGTFDPQQFMSFMEDNKEYIGRKLVEKLAGAQYEMLIKHNGELYLKRFILDSIGEITNTNRFEKYPSSASESPAYYGVVGITLPDSYTVDKQKSKL